jgi:peroxisomal 2,4-dienoyl-CoA reductase
MIFISNRFSSFLCAAEQLSPKGFKTVIDIDTLGTFNMCHAAFPEVDYSSIHIYSFFDVCF